MRTFLIVVAALAASGSPASAESRNFGITSFDKIRIEGPFNVTLKTGVAPFARATGSPAALDRVAIDVQGNTLVVHNSLDSWGGYPGKDAGPVEVSLGTHDLSAAWLNGSGVLDIDRVKGLSFDLSVQGSGRGSIDQVAVDHLDVSVAGSGDATVQSGKAQSAEYQIAGSGEVDAGGMTTQTLKVSVAGSGDVKAQATGTADVTVMGSGDVTVTGGAKCSVSKAGSGDVHCS